MSSRIYSHSPYFLAKRAAQTIAARRMPGACPTVERRVAALGTVDLSWTADFVRTRLKNDPHRSP